MEQAKVPREFLMEIGVWDKAMSQVKKVWRGRSIQSIWDGMGSKYNGSFIYCKAGNKTRGLNLGEQRER